MFSLQEHCPILTGKILNWKKDKTKVSSQVNSILAEFSYAKQLLFVLRHFILKFILSHILFEEEGLVWFGLVCLFNNISPFVDYLMPKQSL